VHWDSFEVELWWGEVHETESCIQEKVMVSMWARTDVVTQKPLSSSPVLAIGFVHPLSQGYCDTTTRDQD
jgi:hypothetical protein